ncbi:MAG: transposase, partial [Cyanobacteriota bacterium]
MPDLSAFALVAGSSAFRKRSIRRHLFLTSLRTSPDALLRLIRQRWSIENKWHWARDAQLGEDAHRYTNRTGAP